MDAQPVLQLQVKLFEWIYFLTAWLLVLLQGRMSPRRSEWGRADCARIRSAASQKVHHLRCASKFAQDKRAFECEAAAGATESFWKIVTNIALRARQVEPCPLFDLCHSLTFISSLTKQEVKVLLRRHSAVSVGGKRNYNQDRKVGLKDPLL